MPPQQSPSCAHASPSWTQNELLPHTPEALQKPEQQSPAPEHGFPPVLQVVLMAAHAPFEHELEQHWPSTLHWPPSAVHWFAEHTPSIQLVVQQSVFALHDVSGAEHSSGFASQVPL